MKTLPLLLLVTSLAFSCVAGPPEPQSPAAAAPVKNTQAAASAVKSPRPITYDELSALLATPGSRILMLDVRTKEEYDAGHIPASVLMPFDAIPNTFSEADKNRPIVVYCRSGRRSEIAADTLVRMGYTDVADLGAIGAWKGPLVQ